jgi:hypothetical protein
MLHLSAPPQLVGSLFTYHPKKTMTPDQRLKLAQALITEAVVCSDKNDIDEARHLTQLAVRHEFKDEMERIIKGDVELFKMTFKKMYSQNIKEKIVARVMLDMLIEDKDFQKTFRDKYIHVSHELWIFEKQQEWKYNG